VTVIAHELRGFRPVGGMGTATTYLALALARLGHSVEILLGKHDPRAIDPYWEDVYRSAAIAIRQVPESAERVEPWEFAHAHRVLLGLRDEPPDIVVAHDFGAPAYSALRIRQAGFGFDETLFVVFCHGPRRYVLDLAPERAPGDLRSVLGVSILEQAVIELADVVVSPSAFLLDWMRAQGWSLPHRALVIPYFTRASATGEGAWPSDRPSDDPLERLTFFGRIDEKKGLKVFAAALNRLEPGLLDGIEIELVGKPTSSWPRDRVAALLPRSASVVIAGELEQQDALERIARPGTLVVMPSLQENSPNAVYECLERRIPFIASNVGGVPELVAADDRARVLFEPTAEHLEGTLRAVLAAGRVPAPARPGFEADRSLDRWREVTELRPAPRRVPDVGDAEYVIVPDADATVRDALVRAQRATGADIVTCGLRLPDGRIHLFAGDAGGLGAVANAYGTVALLRRDLLRDVPHAWPEERDTCWPLLAGLAASGASIVSVPLPLAESATPPGTVEDDPAAALRAVQQLERMLPDQVRGSARLAAGLAAAAVKPSGRPDA
jgi:glycosyltransferase involved in cell wall biosynthesis